MNLRPYQQRAVSEIGRCLSEFGSTLLVLPTGGGKTVVFAHAIKDHCPPDKRAMVLAHREELVSQNARTIGAILGEPCDIERAEQRADLPGTFVRKARVIVASKDSLHPKRLERFDPSEFGMIVTDESHHAIADSYTRIYDYFKGVPHLGVTATPDRTDEEALGKVYASCAMRYEIADAIHDGYLVPVRARTVVVNGLDLSGVGTTGGDLNQGELAEQMERERAVHEVASSAIELAGNRRAIVFTVSVRQAEQMCMILNDYSADCAKWLCGTTPKEERAAIIAAHKRGECQFLVNVGVLTEGYDDPGVSMIVMARPTKSRSLFAQMLGRGTRPLPGLIEDIEDESGRRLMIQKSDKPDLLVVDYTGNCGRHKLVTPADVLGGKYSEKEIAIASLAAADGEVDVMAALDRARNKAQVTEDERIYRESRAKIVTAAKYLLTEENLFDSAFAPGRERSWLTGKAPTENQLATLERHGFKREDAARMSRNECSRLIGQIVARVSLGLCTVKQAKLLARFGVKEPQNVSFDQARAILDRRMAGAR